MKGAKVFDLLFLAFTSLITFIALIAFIAFPGQYLMLNSSFLILNFVSLQLC